MDFYLIYLCRNKVISFAVLRTDSNYDSRASRVKITCSRRCSWDIHLHSDVMQISSEKTWKGLAKLDNVVREHVNHNAGAMFVDFSCCRWKWPNWAKLFANKFDPSQIKRYLCCSSCCLKMHGQVERNP